jgi:hypothetical protein
MILSARVDAADTMHVDDDLQRGERKRGRGGLLPWRTG